MTWAFCNCGWVSIGESLGELGTHWIDNKEHKVRFRSFNQPHMSSDGVERLLAEAKWGRS